MDYEKKYKEALERAKGVVEQNPLMEYLKKGIEYILPELKESEDERIRKGLIRFLTGFKEELGNPPAFCKVSTDEAIAWLEKQGEQKQDPCVNCKDVMLNCDNFPCIKKRAFKQGKSALEVINEEKVDNANKVEPMFHEGDWLCENAPNNYARFIQILEIVNLQGKERYRISRDIHNDEDIVECRFIENNYHSFTIADAKAGDVLVIQETDFTYESIFIFNKIENNHIIQYLHYFITDTDEEVCKVKSVGGFLGDVGDNVHPATKEQRERLKKAMADAEYRWSQDKKKMEKIEQKPAWSEEDMSKIQRICKYLDEAKKYYADITEVRECIDWLKSLRPQNTWKPSDEQIKAVRLARSFVTDDFGENPTLSDVLVELEKQLKKLTE